MKSIIRALFDRVEALEAQIEQLDARSNTSGIQRSSMPTRSKADAMIEEFFNGAGI